MVLFPLTIVFKSVSLHLRLKRAESDFTPIAQDAALSMTDLNSVDLKPTSEARTVSSRVQRTKVPFVERSLTTTEEVGSFPSHRMMQCLLPKIQSVRTHVNEHWRRSMDALILIPGKRIALS